MKVIINSPSLNINKNVSGISSITEFIMSANKKCHYKHFEIGKPDSLKRGLFWFLIILRSYYLWMKLLIINRDASIHFNIPFERRAILRDTPYILLFRILRFRSIIHFHGGEYLLSKSLPWWLKKILISVISKKQKLVVLSSEEKETIKTIFPDSEVFVLPNCIDLTQASGFQRQSSDYDELVILFMGRISINKGISTVFDSLVLLKESGVKFRFILAGKGSEEKEYVKKFSNLLEDNFEFYGVVSGISKLKVLQRSNVFLLPSYFEGLPMALLESMAFGIVPVCSDVGSMKYVVSDMVNGMSVKVNAPVELFQKTKLLYTEPPIRRRLGKNARDFVFNNYDPARYISTLNSIYDYGNSC